MKILLWTDEQYIRPVCGWCFWSKSLSFFSKKGSSVEPDLTRTSPKRWPFQTQLWRFLGEGNFCLWLQRMCWIWHFVGDELALCSIYMLISEYALFFSCSTNLTQSYDVTCFSLKGCISSKHFSMHQSCAFGQVCCVHVKRHCKRLRQHRCAGGRGWTSWTVIETCRGYGARILLLLFYEDRKKQGEKQVQCHKFWWIQSWTYWFAKCTILIRGHFIWHQAVSGSQWSVRM